METVQRSPLRLSVPLLIAAASVVLVIIGSIGPWAWVPSFGYGYGYVGKEAYVFTVYGTSVHGMIPLTGDGMFSAILGSVSGLLILWRLLRPGASGFVLFTASVLLLVSGIVGVVNWANVGNVPTPDPDVFFRGDVGLRWGLIMMTLGAWPGVVFTGYQLWKDELQ